MYVSYYIFEKVWVSINYAVCKVYNKHFFPYFIVWNCFYLTQKVYSFVNIFFNIKIYMNYKTISLVY